VSLWRQIKNPLRWKAWRWNLTWQGWRRAWASLSCPWTWKLEHPKWQILTKLAAQSSPGFRASPTGRASHAGWDALALPWNGSTHRIRCLVAVSRKDCGSLCPSFIRSHACMCSTWSISIQSESAILGWVCPILEVANTYTCFPLLLSRGVTSRAWKVRCAIGPPDSRMITIPAPDHSIHRGWCTWLGHWTCWVTDWHTAEHLLSPQASPCAVGASCCAVHHRGRSVCVWGEFTASFLDWLAFSRALIGWVRVGIVHHISARLLALESGP